MSALVCNALWFISLALSLTCALVATLVEQWARDFLHRSEIRSAPLVRARMFSFLYFGLKRFKMHAVVDVIPLLLHISLLFFFAGLVAFLVPVNIAMSVLSSITLFAVSAVYCALTLLPLLYLDCPYHTPLSAAFWRPLRKFGKMWRRRHASQTQGDDQSGPQALEAESVITAILKEAMQPSIRRSARDTRALFWTLKSLSDDIKLEPFVEAIPDILWGEGPNGERQHAYADQFRALVLSPEVRLFDRVREFSSSCYTGLLSFDARNHRLVSCYKAYWAIATAFTTTPYTPIFFMDSPVLGPGNKAVPYFEFSLGNLLYIGQPTIYPVDPSSNADIAHHMISAVALMRWVKFRAVRARLTELRVQLIPDLDTYAPNLLPVTAYLSQLCMDVDYVQWRRSWETCDGDELLHIIEQICNRNGWMTLAYIWAAATLTSPPYRWKETLEIIKPVTIHFPFAHLEVEQRLGWILKTHLDTANTAESGWMDEITGELLCFWRPQDPSVIIPSPLILYFTQRHSDNAVQDVLSISGVYRYIWLTFLHTLHNTAVTTSKQDSSDTSEDLLIALWRTTKLSRDAVGLDLSIYDPLVNVVLNRGCCSISTSVIALLKNRFYDIILSSDPGSIDLTRATWPNETAITMPSVDEQSGSLWSAFRDRISEARVCVFADFLESCLTDPPPYKAFETIQSMALSVPALMGPIHDKIQTRLTCAIQNIYSSPS